MCLPLLRSGRADFPVLDPGVALVVRFASLEAFRPSGEELLQGGHVGCVGTGFYPVETFASEARSESFVAFFRCGLITLAHPRVACVDFHHLGSFRIFQCDQADVGQAGFAGVAEHHIDQVVALADKRKGLKKASSVSRKSERRKTTALRRWTRLRYSSARIGLVPLPLG